MKSPAHGYDAGVFQMKIHQGSVEVAQPDFDVVLKTVLGDLLPRLIEHGLRIVVAKQARAPRQLLTHSDQHGRGRATEVVHIRGRNPEVPADIRDHVELFRVEGHAAFEHVIEYFGDFRVELEIAGWLSVRAKNFVFFHVPLFLPNRRPAKQKSAAFLFFRCASYVPLFQIYKFPHQL